MSDDMVAFLRARLDERQEAAEEAREGPREERWRAKGYDHVVQRGYKTPGVLGEPHLIADCGPMGPRRVRHIVLNDPEYALRDAEAKRKILAELQQEIVARRDLRDSMATEGNRSYQEGFADGVDYCLNAAISALAAVWSDHPDYRQEWLFKRP